jgi:hypothetical protein
MYAFFARARAKETVFFCPEINYWVVTTRWQADRARRVRAAEKFMSAGGRHVLADDTL